MSEIAINYKGSSIATMDASGTKTLLTSGKYCEDDIEVVYTRPAVPSPTLQTKSKSYTPTTSQQTESVTADNGYDGLAEVDITVGAIPSQYIIPSGSETKTANGTYDVTNLAELVVSVSPNLVTGTFTVGSTGGQIETVNIPYSGSGYPLAMLIVVNGGMYNSTASGQSAWYNSKVRYALGLWGVAKAVQDATPTYATSGQNNGGTTVAIYKNSTSDATSYTRTSSNATITYNSDDCVGNSANGCVRFKGNGNKFTYFTANGSTSSYGFLPNIVYRYYVIYSA